MADEGRVSEFVSRQLSEIMHQLGQTASAIENIREDLRSADDASKYHRDNVASRLENLAERTGKLETLTKETKDTMDKSVMPLVRSAENRKMQLSGALKVWAGIITVATGLSAVFWDRVITALIWMTGR